MCSLSLGPQTTLKSGQWLRCSLRCRFLLGISSSQQLRTLGLAILLRSYVGEVIQSISNSVIDETDCRILTDIHAYNCLLLTSVSNNLKLVYKRSVGVPLSASLANIAGLVWSQIYPASGGPNVCYPSSFPLHFESWLLFCSHRYIKGNAISLGMETIPYLSIIAMYILLKRRNRKKQELIHQRITDNGKKGDQGLDFLYNL